MPAGYTVEEIRTKGVRPSASMLSVELSGVSLGNIKIIEVF